MCSDYSLPKPTPRRSIKNLAQHENYAYDTSYPSLESHVKRLCDQSPSMHSATLNMPTPRKPRKLPACSTLKRETEIRITSSSTSSVRHLLFDPTATPVQQKRMYFNSPYINRREQRSNYSTGRIPRPNAPPPPPPTIGFLKLEKSILSTNTDEHPRIIKNMGSFDYLGFEHYQFRNDSNSHHHHVINMPNRKYLLATSSLDSTEANEMITPRGKNNLHPKHLIQVTVGKIDVYKRICEKWKIFTSSLERPIMSTRKFISLWIYTFSIIIFLSCITFIISFQVHVHDFYKKSLSFKQIVNNLTEKSGEDSIVADENYALIASTQLINRTVLFCNSPYLSYQANNLIVLPFSLLLTIIFSFFSKRESFCVNKCSGRPGIPASINPFLKRNRFLNAALFCILANEVFKMLESSVFDSSTKNAKSFNTTSELFNFVSSNLRNMTNFDNGLKNFQLKNSNSDFLAIGLGIQPNILSNKQKRLNTTTKSIMMLGPVTMNYLKPRLPPRLDLPLVTVTEAPSVIHRLAEANLRLLKHARNKSFSLLSKFNNSLTRVNDTFLNNTFDNVMNMTPNEFLWRTYDYTLKHMPTFKWFIIVEKLESLAIIICEVFIIGMRYYPLFGILDKRSLVCSFLATLYIWADLVYNVLITGLCEGLKLNLNFNFIKNIQLFFINYNNIKNGVLEFEQNQQQNDFNSRLLFSTSRIIYTIVKCLPHFFCLSFVAVRITANLVKLIYDRIKDIKYKIRNANEENTMCVTKRRNYLNQNVDYLNYGQNIVNWKFKNSPMQTEISKKTVCKLGNNYIFSFEDRYVNALLKSKKRFSIADKEIKKSLISNFIDKFIWSNDIHFRYSTRVICTYTVCFTLVYYLTCFLMFYSLLIIDLLSLNKFYKTSTIVSILLTTLVTFVQLFVSLKKFRIHLISLYKGGKNANKYVNSKESYSNQKLALGSFNYAGYAVTYTCWGYLILFLFLIFICTQLTTLYSVTALTNPTTASLQTLVQNTTSSLTLFIIIVLLPFLFSIFLVNLINKLLSRCAARFCFLQKNSKLFALKNRRLFGFFLYYKFFYDCFMGIASCLTRMFKSVLFGVLFMSRLDYSFMGRSLERMDSAFMSYVGFLHWESHHTNPILISFCQLLKKLVKQKESSCTTIGKKICTNKKEQNEYEKLCLRKRITNKWHLFRILLKNPQLIEYRKHKLIR